MPRHGERDLGKERYWRRWIRQWQGSGRTIRDFCAEHSLSEASFYAWRRTIAERDAERSRPNRQARADDQPLFVPVQVVPTAATTASAGLELVVGQGRVVRVTPGFDAATLRQLLAVLEEPSC